MGYIFDALKRNKQAREEEAAKQAEQLAADTAAHEHADDANTAEPSEEAYFTSADDASDSAVMADAETESITTNEICELLAIEEQKAEGHILIEPTEDWLSDVDDRLIGLREPGSVMAEEYRAIRTSLLARWNNERHIVHTITSATPQEGKTITSLNLGLTFAELHNRRTIVIEADLRLPTFEKLLHLGTDKGLIGYLRGEYNLNEVIHQIADNGLHIIPAGGRANNDAVQMLSSQRMCALIDHLRSVYDHIIIDTPPVVELADAGILGSQSDDVLLIARMNRTPRMLIDQAIKTLTSYNAPVSGMIATDQKRIRNKHYYYRYGYRYRYNNRYYTKQAA